MTGCLDEGFGVERNRGGGRKEGFIFSCLPNGFPQKAKGTQWVLAPHLDPRFGPVRITGEIKARIGFRSNQSVSHLSPRS